MDRPRPARLTHSSPLTPRTHADRTGSSSTRTRARPRAPPCASPSSSPPRPRRGLCRCVAACCLPGRARVASGSGSVSSLCYHGPPRPRPRPRPRPLLQALYYLSGLTCTDENFVQKAHAQRSAAQRGLALIAPDTRCLDRSIPSHHHRLRAVTSTTTTTTTTTPRTHTHTHTHTHTQPPRRRRGGGG